MQNINSILKEYWGFDTFRELQADIILSVLEGKDTLAILPTGGGKSICFQVPAMAKEGICLVISPLIALMKDQVQNLQRKGIPALAIYSGMSFAETKRTMENAAYGNYKFLYISPERLETNLFKEYLPAFKISLVAVDEAHCISQWGYDFRPSYLRIATIRESLPGIPLLALTASATADVQDDICEKLLFGKDAQRFNKSFERPNLSYSVFNSTAKQNKLLEIVQNVKGSGIVYCRTRKHTKDVADLLKMHKVSADFYHAGLSNAERNEKQDNWIKNRTRIIVSTNAFGMGIDKPDVRFVVHYDLPDCLENYYQEAGRAGRDEKRAYAVLLYNDKETADLLKQADTRYPAEETIKNVYTSLMNYLQIPAYSGADTNHDFDLSEFCRRFKLNILDATYSIKMLEQEELISFNELFFKPSTVVFTINRQGLQDFEKSMPEYEDLIKGLLRSYEGIFDFPASIYESQLSAFLSVDINDLRKKISELNKLGILDYTPQKDKPQVILLRNRIHSNDFRINSADHLKRKKKYEERVNALIAYITNTGTCRSRLIAAYFNDETVNKCTICDNCISGRSVTISKEEFEKISSVIMDTLQKGNVPVKVFLNGTGSTKKEKTWKVIDYLVAEKMIRVSPDGTMSRN